MAALGTSCDLTQSSKLSGVRTATPSSSFTEEEAARERKRGSIETGSDEGWARQMGRRIKRKLQGTRGKITAKKKKYRNSRTETSRFSRWISLGRVPKSSLEGSEQRQYTKWR